MAELEKYGAVNGSLKIAGDTARGVVGGAVSVGARTGLIGGLISGGAVFLTGAVATGLIVAGVAAIGGPVLLLGGFAAAATVVASAGFGGFMGLKTGIIGAAVGAPIKGVMNLFSSASEIGKVNAIHKSQEQGAINAIEQGQNEARKEVIKRMSMQQVMPSVATAPRDADMPGKSHFLSQFEKPDAPDAQTHVERYMQSKAAAGAVQQKGA